jgi:hypothetical protein
MVGVRGRGRWRRAIGGLRKFSIHAFALLVVVALSVIPSIARTTHVPLPAKTTLPIGRESEEGGRLHVSNPTLAVQQLGLTSTSNFFPFSLSLSLSVFFFSNCPSIPTGSSNSFINLFTLCFSSV